MKNKTKAHNRSSEKLNWEFIVKLLGVILTAGGLIFGIYQFVVKRKQEAAAVRYNRKSAVYTEAMQLFGGGLKKWEEANDPSDFTKPADFEYFPSGQDKPGMKFNDMSYHLSQVCRRGSGN